MDTSYFLYCSSGRWLWIDRETSKLIESFELEKPFDCFLVKVFTPKFARISILEGGDKLFGRTNLFGATFKVLASNKNSERWIPLGILSSLFQKSLGIIYVFLKKTPSWPLKRAIRGPKEPKNAGAAYSNLRFQRECRAVWVCPAEDPNKSQAMPSDPERASPTSSDFL